MIFIILIYKSLLKFNQKQFEKKLFYYVQTIEENVQIYTSHAIS